MTKKIVFALLVSIAATGTNFSQETAKADSSSAEKIRKNEIGLNVAPVVIILLNGLPQSPKYSVSYKRIFNEKNVLRFGVGYNVRKNPFLVEGMVMSDYYEVLSNTDSTQIRRYKTYNPGNKFQLNFGYERRWGKKKIKQFLGADLLLGYYKSSTYWQDISYYLDSSSTSGGHHWFPVTYVAPPIAYSSYTQNYFIGLSPFYGLYFPLSKRFALSAQIGFDANFSYGKPTIIYAGSNSVSDLPVYSFDFESGLFNDFSLIYRF